MFMGDGNESVEREKLMKDGGAIAGAEWPTIDMSSWVLQGDAEVEFEELEIYYRDQ